MAKQRTDEEKLSIPSLVPTLQYEELKFGKTIGSGGFGEVFKGIWQESEVAIKKLFLKAMENDLFKEFINEASILAKCRHQNITNFFGICQYENNYFLIMEYLDNGTLRSQLNNSSEPLPWEPIRFKIAKGVARGVAYLHSQKIIHQDLKSMNILLNKSWEAKIGDFGLAKIKLETTSTITTRKIGSVRWNAPELFQRGTAKSEQTDIYSLGMVLWEIASRKIPFSDVDDDVMVIGFIKDGETEKIPEDCPKVITSIIEGCWKKNPSSRFSASEIVAQFPEKTYPTSILADNGKEIEEEIPKKKNKDIEDDFWISCLGKDWKSIPHLAKLNKEGKFSESNHEKARYIIGNSIGLDFLKEGTTDYIRTFFFYRGRYQGVLPLDLTWEITLEQLTERFGNYKRIKDYNWVGFDIMNKYHLHVEFDSSSLKHIRDYRLRAI